MSDKRIKVKIDPMGNPTVEAVGFNGVGCTDATKVIESALSGGSGGVTRVLKPEFHAVEEETEHQTMKW